MNDFNKYMQRQKIQVEKHKHTKKAEDRLNVVYNIAAYVVVAVVLYSIIIYLMVM